MSAQEAGRNGEEQASLLSFRASPDTVTNLIKRIRFLTLRLLPVEVPLDTIADPTSRVITPQVIDAYIAAAGDFLEVLPYALLRARKEFMWDANNNPADFGENSGRAVACEVLARRVIHQAPSEKVVPMMARRFRYTEVDGGMSDKASALELAIDSHCTIFLSSTEAQDVVNYLWRGQLIQRHQADHEIDLISGVILTQVGYPFLDIRTFFAYPCGSYSFSLTHKQACLITRVREPLDKLNPDHAGLDGWEVLMYVLALAFSFESEQICHLYKLFLFVSWRSLGFWDVISFLTDSLLLVAFVLRVVGVSSPEPRSVTIRILSFQCLSFVAPLIWMKIIPIFDGFKYVGTMQICVARMLKESGIFFGLLALLGIGFMQGLYALDAADGQAEHLHEVVHVLIQALLQSPDYNMFAASWNVATALILLNVLISLFSSAYNDVVEDAAAEYLTYFAGKVGGMIRAPDEYVYPAPFNIVEILLSVPLLRNTLTDTVEQINRYVMLVTFFVPLSIIALYEADLEPSKNKWIKDWLSNPDEGGEDAPEFENPDVHEDDAARGLKISKVAFEDLVKAFPDTTHSSEAVVLREVRQLKEQIEELKQLLRNGAKI
ncbi:predicted protein [Postia placenta Mad-698-R]|nr:predicted protein [Postia placenta Mad-698-R]